MKKIKVMNGYTIYQHTARDEKEGLTVGEYSIYFSSDVRDFGRENSYAEFEGIETLEICEELCNNNYAVAKEMCEEENTLVTDEDILEMLADLEKESNDMSENEKYLRGIREELQSIYDGEQENEDGEQTSFYDYVCNCLDMEYIINADKTYKSCILWVTLGGPNVCIDTRLGEIRLAWGTDRESLWLPSEICNEIDNCVEDLYNC